MALRPGTTARRIRAGLAPVTAASQADDHRACHSGNHHVIIRVTFDRAAGRLAGTPMYGHRPPDIAKRTAIFHQMTADATSNPNCSTPPCSAVLGTGRMAGQAWLRGTFSGINRPRT